jgi:hypothetical protein
VTGWTDEDLAELLEFEVQLATEYPLDPPCEAPHPLLYSEQGTPLLCELNPRHSTVHASWSGGARVTWHTPAGWAEG